MITLDDETLRLARELAARVARRPLMRFPEENRIKRAVTGYESAEGDRFGLFIFSAREAKGRPLRVIAVEGTGGAFDNPESWDHVSVSLAEGRGVPAWGEMNWVKSVFWEPPATALQIHPPEADYINLGEVLHLWRHPLYDTARPPKICV